MKKVIVILLGLALMVFSCKNEKKSETTNENETTTEVTDNDVSDEDTANSGENTEENSDQVAVPTFENAEIQEYVNSYQEYVNTYKEAFESKDMTKVQEMTAKGQELAQGVSAFADISAEDSKKLQDYMTAKTKEMQEIAMQNTGQQK